MTTPAALTRRAALHLHHAGAHVRPAAPIVADRVVTLRIRVAGDVMATSREWPAVLGIIGRPRARIYADGHDVCIEVPRPRPGQSRAPRLPVRVGRDVRNRAVSVDLWQRHVVVGGQTGSGKSVLLQRLAHGVAAAGGQLALADLDVGTWDGWHRAAALAWAVADEPAAADALVVAVANAVDGRDVGQWPALVLIVDEVQRLGPAGHAALADILARGRKRGVVAVVATQYVRGDVLDRRLTDQCAVRVAGRVTDAAASRLILGQCPDATALAGGGDVLIVAGGCEPARVAVAMVAPGEVAALPQVATSPTAAPVVEVAARQEREDDDDHIEWAIGRMQAGQPAGAEVIQRERGVGMDRARRIRQAALLAYPPTNDVETPGLRVLEYASRASRG